MALDGSPLFEFELLVEAVSSASELEQSCLSLCCVYLIECMKEQSTASNSSSNEVVDESSNCVQSDSQLLDVSVPCCYHVVGDELGNSSSEASDQPSISLKCYQPCNAYPMQLKNKLDVSTKAAQLSLIDPTPPGDHLRNSCGTVVNMVTATAP